MVAVYEEALEVVLVQLKTLGYLMVTVRSGLNYLAVLLQGFTVIVVTVVTVTVVTVTVVTVTITVVTVTVVTIAMFTVTLLLYYCV